MSFKFIRESLHYRILAWLVLPMTLVSALLLVEVYISAQNSTGKIQKRMLVSHALAIMDQAVDANNDFVSLAIIQTVSGNTIFHRTTGSSSAFLTGYNSLPGPSDSMVLIPNEPVFYDAMYRGKEIQMVAIEKVMENFTPSESIQVFVGQFTQERREVIWEQVRASSFRLAVLIALCAGLAGFAIKISLRPIKRIQDQIDRRSDRDLSSINLPATIELRPFIKALNKLFKRLDASLDANRRFAGNASHQLRTPVASLMTQTELLLRRNLPTEIKERIETINARSKQMSNLISQLLILNRVSFEDALPVTTVDFSEITQEACADWLNSNHLSRLEFEIHELEQNIRITGNPVLLREMIFNLLSNANTHARGATLISLSLVSTDDSVFMRVEDNGCGIPVSKREAALQRFHRLDQTTFGSGLGLTIATEVAKAHSGVLSLHSSRFKTGLMVEIRFPIHGYNQIHSNF